MVHVFDLWRWFHDLFHRASQTFTRLCRRHTPPHRRVLVVFLDPDRERQFLGANLGADGQPRLRNGHDFILARRRGVGHENQFIAARAFRISPGLALDSKPHLRFTRKQVCSQLPRISRMMPA